MNIANDSRTWLNINFGVTWGMQKVILIIVFGLLWCNISLANDKFVGYLKCDKLFIIYIDEINKTAKIGSKEYEVWVDENGFDIYSKDKNSKVQEVILINRFNGWVIYSEQTKEADGSTTHRDKSSYCKKTEKKF